MATKRRLYKVFGYFRNARGNLKHTKTNHSFVQNVLQTFVSILVFKSGTQVQVQSRFIFLLFLLVKFINSAIIIKNINVFGLLFAERRHIASYLGYFPSIRVFNLTLNQFLKFVNSRCLLEDSA